MLQNKEIVLTWFGSMMICVAWVLNAFEIKNRSFEINEVKSYCNGDDSINFLLSLSVLTLECWHGTLSKTTFFWNPKKDSTFPKHQFYGCFRWRFSFSSSKNRLFRLFFWTMTSETVRLLPFLGFGMLSFLFIRLQFSFLGILGLSMSLRCSLKQTQSALSWPQTLSRMRFVKVFVWVKGSLRKDFAELRVRFSHPSKRLTGVSPTRQKSFHRCGGYGRGSRRTHSHPNPANDGQLGSKARQLLRKKDDREMIMPELIEDIACWSIGGKRIVLKTLQDLGFVGSTVSGGSCLSGGALFSSRQWCSDLWLVVWWVGLIFIIGDGRRPPSWRDLWYQDAVILLDGLFQKTQSSWRDQHTMTFDGLTNV